MTTNAGRTGALGAETIRDPRTGARESHADLSGLHLIVRLDVVVRAAEHRVDERDVVDVLTEVRKHFRHELSALSVTLELERARISGPGYPWRTTMSPCTLSSIG
jgi:hypothetical protein